MESTQGVIRYYGAAARGAKFGILLVTRRPRTADDPVSPLPTVFVSQEWTGEVLKTWRATQRRVEELNDALFPDVRS